MSESVSGSVAQLEQVRQQIADLMLEHRGLDAMIDSLRSAEQGYDELQMRRLKKRKLQLKDMIVVLQMQLIPDITA